MSGQSEAVRAGTVRHTVDDGVSTTQVIWIGDKPRPGTAVYLAPPAPSVSVPDGWKLVPVEPTPEMIDAIRNGYGWKAAYSALLAAAPEVKP